MSQGSSRRRSAAGAASRQLQPDTASVRTAELAVQLRGRPTVRWPADTGLTTTAARTHHPGKPHPDLPEQPIPSVNPQPATYPTGPIPIVMIPQISRRSPSKGNFGTDHQSPSQLNAASIPSASSQPATYPTGHIALIMIPQRLVDPDGWLRVRDCHRMETRLSRLGEALAA